MQELAFLLLYFFLTVIIAGGVGALVGILTFLSLHKRNPEA